MKNLDRLSKKRLGEILMDEGLVNRTQVQEALQIQKKTSDLLGTILLDITEITETDIARAIATQFQFPILFAGSYKVNPEAVALVPAPTLHENLFLPVDIIGNTLVLVMGGLLSADLITTIEQSTGREVFVYVSTKTDVSQALFKYAPLTGEEVLADELEEEAGFDWQQMFEEADKSLLDELATEE